jgi:hypothetical protein
MTMLEGAEIPAIAASPLTLLRQARTSFAGCMRAKCLAASNPEAGVRAGDENCADTEVDELHGRQRLALGAYPARS